MRSNRNDPRSLLMLASSMLIFGTIGIFRRHIPLSSGILAFARGVIGTAFLYLALLVRKASRSGLHKSGTGKGDRKAGKTEKDDRAVQGKAQGEEKLSDVTGPEGPAACGKAGRMPSARILLLLILSGAMIGFNWILLFESYNYTTVATATLCYYMQPVIVILLSPLIFREELTVRKLVCAAAAVAGMVLLSGIAGEGLPQGDALRGILYGLGAAVLYASVVIMNKCIRNIDAYGRTIVQLGAAAACLAPWLALTGQFSRIEFAPGSLMLLLVVGVVHTGIAYALYFGSTEGLRAQTIALFSYIDPVSALVFSVLLLHEPMTAASLAGAVLILGAALAGELLP